MADKTYEDVNGNVISSPKKVYEDANGNPLGRTIHNDSAQSGKPADSQGGTTPGSDVFRNFVGRFVPSGLGVAGSYGGPALGAAGSFVGEGLRQAAPSLFGGEDSGNVGSDLVVNSLIPGALKSVGKVATDGFRQTLADILASKAGQKLPPVRSLMEGVKGFQADTQAAGDSVVNKASQGYLDASKEAELNYRKKIFGAKDPKVTDPNVATPEGFSLPDPKLFEPRSGDLPKGYSLSGFNQPEPDLNAVKDILQKAQTKVGDTIKNPVLRYARNSLVFRLGALAGLGGISPTSAAVGSTVVLGEAAIKKLVSNPETAQLIIKAINTPGDAQESGLIGKTLINALRGSTVMLKDADGNDTSATISQDGQLQYKK